MNKLFFQIGIFILLLLYNTLAFGQHVIENVSYSSGEYKYLYNDTILSPNDTSKNVNFSNTSQVTYKAPVIRLKKGFGSNGYNSGGFFKAYYPFKICFDAQKDCYSNEGILYTVLFGGKAPFTYSWSTGSTNDTIHYTTNGTYTVTVTDNRGKIRVASYDVISETITNVTWTDLAGITETGDTIWKSVSSGWGNAGAASKNKLEEEADGFLEYQVSIASKDDNISFDRFLGLSESNPNSGYDNIGHAFYFRKDSVYVYESGVLKGNGSKYFAYDRFLIKRFGDSIIYQQNEDTLYLNYNVSNSSKELIVDVAFYDQYAYFSDVKVSFCTQLEAYVDYTVMGSNCSGTIALGADYGVPPYSYLWEDNDTNRIRTNMAVGLYDVTVTDDNGGVDILEIDYLADIEWTNLVRTEARTDTLINIETNPASGAASKNILIPYEEGRIKYSVSHSSYCDNIGKARSLGLSYEDIDATFNSADYHWAFFADGTARIYEKSTLINNTGNYNPGDVFEIKREDGKIKYLKNDIVMQETITDENYPLILDVTIKDSLAYFDHVQASFCVLEDIQANFSFTEVNDTSVAEIEVIPYGGNPPYTFTWHFDTIPASSFLDTLAYLDSVLNKNLLVNDIITDYAAKKIENVLPGIYRCKIKDANGQEKEAEVYVGYETVFHTENNIGFEDFAITKSGENAWTNGECYFNKILDSEQEAYCAFMIAESGQMSSVGFSASGVIEGATSGINYGVHFRNDTAFVIEDGMLESHICSIQKYDHFKIGTSGTGNINVYKNGTLVHSFNNVNNGPYLFGASLYSNGVHYKQLNNNFIAINQFGISYDITDATCIDVNSGSIDLIFNIPWATNVQYQWTGNGVNETTQDISDLSPGTYHVNVIYTIFNWWGVNYNKDVYISYAVTWNNVTNLQQSSINTLQNQTTSAGYANSFNVLPAIDDGHVKYEYAPETQAELMALSFEDNPSSAALSNFDDGFVVIKSGTTEVICIVNNSSLINYYVSTNILDADYVLKKVGSQLKYYVDDLLVYTGSVSSSDLYARPYVLTQNSKLDYTTVSFSCPIPAAIVDDTHVLYNKHDGSYVNVGNALMFRFDEEYFRESTAIVNYKILNENGTVEIDSGTQPDSIKYGYNKYNINVSTLSNGYYLLEVLDERKVKWFLRIKK